MRFTIAAAAAAFVAGASAAANGTVYVTDVVSQYTTYCPEATQVTHNGVTYTVTEATTLTITNCPCTVTRALTSSTPAATPAAPAVAPAYKNGTSGAGSASPTAGAPGSKTTMPVQFTGAANAVTASGAGLAAIFAIAAYAL
ncbi:hypothetical protein MBLNU457_7415t1 [Dothideomycetes sp. NU457]